MDHCALTIGMVTPEFRPAIGGAERTAEALGRALVARGHEVWILTGRWRRSDPRREDDDGFHVVRHFTLWNGFGVKICQRLARCAYLASLAWHLIWLGRRCQVWHVHQALSWAAVTVWVARWLHRPVVVKVTAGPVDFDLRIIRPWLRTTVLQADRFVCVSGTSRRLLLAEGVDPRRVSVIPNGVDVHRFAAPDDRDGTTVIYTGRLEAIKGVDQLLEAVAHLTRSDRFGSWRLHIVGSGSQLQALQHGAAELGLTGVVEWLGSRTDLEDLLKSAQIFIQPSRSEGMSNSLLEAMSCGLASVATDVGGTRELLGYSQAPQPVAMVTETAVGLLVPPNSAEALAEALARLLADVTLRRAMGRAARARAEALFTLEHVASAYEALYRGVLARESSGAQADPRVSDLAVSVQGVRPTK